MLVSRGIISAILLLAPLIVCAEQSVRIVSYNVENFFDYKADAVKDDAAFTPSGDHYWNSSKFQKKNVNIARVLTAVGGWEGAAIIGLYEVENDYVLDNLTKYSPLKRRGYKYVHYESNDARGIDVAMLYDPKRVTVLKSRAIKAVCSGDTLATRDVLYVKTLVQNSDTLHFFLCHTPSRRGGVEASSWRRECVMKRVRTVADSINRKGKANIIVMGDFNDFPDNKSMCEALGAQRPVKTPNGKSYYNLFWQFEDEGRGTYKFQGEWNMLDQIIVSGSLLKRVEANIYDADFLLEDDIKYFGKKPFRTYNGRRYIGGYSDHLPIYMDLFLKKEK